MTGSPKALTTAEARRRYEAACDVLDRMCERGAASVWRMSIPAQPNDTDLVLGDALLALRELIEARDEAAELRAALRTLVADLEALMEESHIELYDGDGNLVGISWGKLLQGGKDEYLSNWRDVKRLARGTDEQ